MQKVSVICLLFVYLNISLADVSLVESNSGHKKKPIKQHVTKPKTIEQYQIEGYADAKYVRFVVNVESKNIVNGHRIASNGNKTYVSGEVVDGVLHLYDSKGGHFTVIIAE